MKKKIQQGGMYWDGKKFVPNTIPWQNGSAFKMGGKAPCYNCGGGYPHMDYGGIPPANTDVAMPYTANGMTQWQGQGIDFRSPNPYAAQTPMMQKPLQILMPKVPMGNDQMTYGNYGQGYMPGAVGNGAEGDVFANAHGPEFKKGGHWIPKHLKKGRCTPAPNPDCPVGSPQYNLAMTFKKHHGFHQYGGSTMPRMDGGGNPWQTVYNPDAIQEQIYAQRDNTQDVITQNADMYSGQPMATSDNLSPNGNGTNPNYWQQVGQQAQNTAVRPQQRPGNGFKNLLGAGMIAGAYFADRKSQRDMQMQNMNNGMTTMNGMNPLGGHGDYTQAGMFRPNDRVPTMPGKFYPGYAMGGPIKKYKNGDTYSVDDRELQALRDAGYDFDIID